MMMMTITTAIIMMIIIIMIMMMMMMVMMMTTTTTTTMMMMMMMMMMMITFKGAIQDFVQSPHCAANCLQHVRSSGQGAIACKSRATHQGIIACNTSCWYEETAQLLSPTELKSHFFLALSIWLNHLTKFHYTDAGPASPSSDPITPGGRQDSH